MKQNPDFKAFASYLSGKQPASRLHRADLLIDDSILEQYTVEVLNQKWTEREADAERYFRNYTDCFYHMGFDYIPVHFWIQNTFRNFPEPESWIAHDKGLITTEQEYSDFPWDKISVDYSSLDILSEYLPEGMKLVPVTGDLQDLMDCIVGTVSFLMMIYDNPSLLDKLINKWYGIKHVMIENFLKYETVGAVFSCADMGSSHSVLISPDFIREKLIPWYGKFSKTVHEQDRLYWFHCCGNIYAHNVMDMLLEGADIDAFHSFQDSILPVADFLEQYGRKTAALGGIDLDKLCRLEEKDLRKYIRDTISRSLSKGRYAAGTGNSVAGYVPFKNWLILLEEIDNYTFGETDEKFT